MAYNLGVVMDPIQAITPEKDTSLALLLEAARRGYNLFYLEMADLYVQDGVAYGRMRPLTVQDDSQQWHQLGEAQSRPLADLDCILMRKDPPFDMEFMYATYILEMAEQAGTTVVNRCAGLRDFNEKMAINQFPQLCAPTLVTRDMQQLREFINQHKDCVIKPLDGMGGSRIFRLQQGNGNISVTLEVLTNHGQVYAMIQGYVPAIKQGDKRIIMINGEPVEYALARIPAQGELRGNIAAGGTAIGQPLTDADYAICQTVGPVLKQKGLYFVGLDVIGDKLTEINVTSPTGVRQLDRQYNINIASRLFDAISST